MAWTTSKVFAAMLHDALSGTAAFDLQSDTLRVALYGSGVTPDNTVSSADSAYGTGQWAPSNEIYNGGWPAGGLVLPGHTWTRTGNLCRLAGGATANPTPATLVGIHGALVYDDTLTAPVADQGLSFHSMGGEMSVSAGTVTLVWNTPGVLAITAT